MPHQPLQERKPIHARHFDVEREHVGLKREDLVAGDIGIGRCANDFHIRFSGDRIAEDLAHDGRIVDDEDLDPATQHAHWFSSTTNHVVMTPLSVSRRETSTSSRSKSGRV